MKKLKGNATDLELVQEWQSQKNYEVIDILYERYEQKLFQFFLFKTNQFDDAEDLLHETSIKMMTGLEQFQQKSSFQSWLFKIAGNTLRDYWRKQKRELDQRKMWVPNQHQDEPDFLDIEKLRRCLTKLSKRENDIVYFKDVEQKTFREIGECSVFQFSAQNVQKIYKNAREKLLKCMKNQWMS